MGGDSNRQRQKNTSSLWGLLEKKLRGQTKQPPDPFRIESFAYCLVPLLGQHTQKISRSVKDAMDQYDVVLHFIKNQIVVDDKNAVTKRSELGSLRNTTNERVGGERL